MPQENQTDQEEELLDETPVDPVDDNPNPENDDPVVIDDETPVKEENEDEPRIQQYIDDPRAAIARAYTVNRGETVISDEEPAIDNIEPDFSDPRILTGTNNLTREAEPEPEPEPATDHREPDDEQVTLKVNGQDVTMSLSELKKTAAQNLASDQRLDEAKRYANEARELRDSLIQQRNDPPANTTGQEQGVQTTDATQSNDEATQANHSQPDYDALAETLQVGDTEEAGKALKEALESVTATRPDNTVNRDDLSGMISQEIENRDRARVFSTYQANNTDIFEDPTSQLVFGQKLTDEIKTDLGNAGVSSDRLAMLTSTKMAAEAHNLFQREGLAGIRDAKEILESAGNAVRDFRGTKAVEGEENNNSTESMLSNREVRKQGLQQQPRRANQAPTTGTKTPQYKRKSGSEVVAGMRHARGQSVVP